MKSEIGSKKGLFKEQKMGYFRKTNFHLLGEIIFQQKKRLNESPKTFQNYP